VPQADPCTAPNRITIGSPLRLERAGFPREKLVAFVTLIITPAGRYLFEGLAGIGENCGSAGCRLIASDNDINVAWIELDAAACPPGLLGGDKRRPAAEEGVENSFSAFVLISTMTGKLPWTGRLLAALLRNKKRAALTYPIMKVGRKITLKALGVSQI
jgi:hypothetical protein